METQTPAEGILKRHDWGGMTNYYVVCDCGNAEHTHDVWVEATEVGVEVCVYVTARTKYINPEYLYWRDGIFKKLGAEFKYAWKTLKSRARLTWNIWVHNSAEYETSIIMSRQQALNYASTLGTAVHESEKYREDRRREK